MIVKSYAALNLVAIAAASSSLHFWDHNSQDYAHDSHAHWPEWLDVLSHDLTPYRQKDYAITMITLGKRSSSQHRIISARFRSEAQ